MKGIIIFLLISLILLIVFYLLLRAVNLSIFRTFVRTVLLPRPLFSYGLLKLFSVFTEDPLKGIIGLRTAIEDRFGNAFCIPIVLFHSNGKEEFEGLFYKVEGFSWYLNEKMAIVVANEEKFESVVALLHDIFEGRGFSAFCMDMELSVGRISLAEKITGNQIPCFLLRKVHLLKPENFSHLGIIGDLREEQTLERFLEKIFYKSLRSSQEDVNFLFDLQTLQQIKNIEFPSLYSNFILRGFTFYCDNNPFFLRDFLSKEVYHYCNECVFKDNTSSNSQKILKRTLQFFAVLAIIIFSLKIRTSFSINSSLFKSLTFIERSLGKEERNLTDQIQTLGLDQFSFAAQKLCPTETQALKDISNFILLASQKQFSIELDKSPETFSYSPCETHLFSSLREKTLRVLDSYEELYSFVKAEGDPDKNQKLLRYSSLVRENLLSFFEVFFENFANFNLFVEIEKIQELLKSFSLSTEINLEEVVNFLEKISDVKNAIRTTTNWWMNENLNYRAYQELLQRIERSALIGKELREQVTYMESKVLNILRNRILQTENNFFGKFFAVQNNIITITESFSKFISLLSALTQDPVFQLPISSESLVFPMEKQFLFWDPELLDYIVSSINLRADFLKNIAEYNLKTRHFAQKLADRRLKQFLYGALFKAQKIQSNKVQLKDRVKNFLLAAERLNLITSFAKNTLNESFYMVNRITEDSLSKLGRDILQIFSSSIFTNYKLLSDWKGQNLCHFLFQQSEEDLPFLIMKTVDSFKAARYSFILPLIDYMAVYCPEYHRSLFYFAKEIEAYEKGEKNQIKHFENFLLQLQDWKLYWRPETTVVDTNDFFQYHLRAFQSFLIKKTNELLLEQSQEIYQEICNFFNAKLADRFPFTKTKTTEFAPVENFILFLEKYNQNRDRLQSDKGFNRDNISTTLKSLEQLSNCFVLKNGCLFFNLNLVFNVLREESEKTNLIKYFSTIFGTETFKTDQLRIKYDVSQGFSLKIEIANSSSYIIGVSQLGICTDFSITFNFDTLYGFFLFVEKFKYKRSGTDMILRIVIPLVDKKTGQASEIITYISVQPYPFFPTKI